MNYSEGTRIWTAILFAVIANVLATLGSLLSEKFCKDAHSTPFYVQMFQIMVLQLFRLIADEKFSNLIHGCTGDDEEGAV